jgi:hypothetical protein
MAKVVVKQEDDFGTIIHHFLSEAEARAYILAVREFGIGIVVSIRLDGKEV